MTYGEWRKLTGLPDCGETFVIWIAAMLNKRAHEQAAKGTDG